MRNSRLSRLAVILVCGFLGWLAYLVGPNPQWRPDMASILLGTQGPVADVAAVAALATAVFMLVFGDQNGGLRKLGQSAGALLFDLARWLTGGSRAPLVPACTAAGTHGAVNIANGLYYLELRATPVAAAVSASESCVPRPVLPGMSERPVSNRRTGTYFIAGDKPRWQPTRVFDDGERVYLRFRQRALQQEMPRLYVRGTTGQYQPVAYRMEGPVSVVDQLFDTAELRSSGRREFVVRIKYAS